MQKRIIIIGASSGIGRRLAELYSANGHLVGIAGRRLELLKEIKQQSTQHMDYECFDVRKDDVLSHLEALSTKLGGLDILFISAGMGEVSKELNLEIDKATVDTNVRGFLMAANRAFNFFLRNGQGQLVTISSIAANRGISRAPAYNASKAFQSIYFEGLAIKAAKMKKNITVTCIEPGFVATKMARSNKLFWVVPVDKATRQIMHAIAKKRRKAYISRRWWLIAKLLKFMPYIMLKKLS